MPRFAANLSMLFTEHDFLDRFAEAAKVGFTGVEYLFPYDHPAEQVAKALQDAGLTQVLFNAPPGDWEAGERGIASLPGRDEEFEQGIRTALAYAKALDCTQLHVMAGNPQDRTAATTAERYVDRIRLAADLAAPAGVRILIEPINPYDMPGYFLASVAQARELLPRIDRDNVGLQLDLYHAQITDGNITRLIRETTGTTRHVQIASVPARQEPDAGELRVEHALAVLDEAGYEGWVGCEYRPAAGTVAGLGWLDRFRAIGGVG